MKVRKLQETTAYACFGFFLIKGVSIVKLLVDAEEEDTSGAQFLRVLEEFIQEFIQQSKQNNPVPFLLLYMEELAE